MIFKIRPMHLSDLVAVESIQAEAYHDYFLESVQVIERRFRSSPATAWVAESENKVCAYLVGYMSKVGKINPLNEPFSPVEDSDCLYLHDLALLKSAQGYGLARQLIEAAIHYAINSFVSVVALLSVQNSKQFWQGLGFSESINLNEAERGNAKTYVTGNAEASYMVKRLLF
ncbi:MAG: GNAT family N-acetyltransferase [Gammaproteobacteria bacterium]|nr:MAG: GNAT family N-acetyltransferase [Gammaproteobacteria bacterium]